MATIAEVVVRQRATSACDGDVLARAPRRVVRCARSRRRDVIERRTERTIATLGPAHAHGDGAVAQSDRAVNLASSRSCAAASLRRDRSHGFDPDGARRSRGRARSCGNRFRRLPARPRVRAHVDGHVPDERQYPRAEARGVATPHGSFSSPHRSCHSERGCKSMPRMQARIRRELGD